MKVALRSAAVVLTGWRQVCIGVTAMIGCLCVVSFLLFCSRWYTQQQLLLSEGNLKDKDFKEDVRTVVLWVEFAGQIAVFTDVSDKVDIFL